MDRTIKLGCVARDKVTGVNGVVIAHCELLHNCDRFTLQPKGLGKDGKPFETRSCDVLSLEYVGPSRHAVTPPTARPEASRPQLGDAVKDGLSGATGIVVRRTTWDNGCLRVVVQPQKLKGGAPLPELHLDEAGIAVTKRGVVAPAARAKTGGPRSEPQRR